MKKTEKILEIEKKIGEPIENYLKREYEVNRKYTTQIAKYIGTSNSTICRWMKKLKIKTRGILETRFQKGFVKPTKEELNRWYNEERRNTIEIGKELGISAPTISRWMGEYGIKRRDNSESNLPRREFSKPSKKEMEGWYLNEHKGMSEIAKKLGVSTPTVNRLLREYNIPIKTNSESHLPRGFVKPGKNELYNEYVVKRNTMPFLAEKYKVSIGAIRDWLENNNLRRRTASEVNLPEGISKLTKEELERLYFQEGLFLPQIAEKKGLGKTTVVRWFREYGLKNNKERYNDKDYRKKVTDKLIVITGKRPEELIPKDFERVKTSDNISFRSVINWYMRKYKCKSLFGRDKLLEDLYDIDVKDINNKIDSKDKFLNLLKKDKTALKLSAAALSLNGQGYDLEKTIVEVCEGRFKDEKQLHALLLENENEIYNLVQNGVTNLGKYLGQFTFGDRRIMPLLLGEALESIPENKVTTPLEERFARILRSVYSPKFNKNQKRTMDELEKKIDNSKNTAKSIYQKLYNHYEEVLELEKELEGSY